MTHGKYNTYSQAFYISAESTKHRFENIRKINKIIKILEQFKKAKLEFSAC